MNSPTTNVLPVSFDDVRAAAARIHRVAHKTPVLASRTANQRAGAELFFKCENFQRAGAFKFRGAYNVVALLNDEQRKRGLVTCSSGNHAQALALAASLRHVPTTIVMPEDAPEAKMRAAIEYGGEIVHYDRYTENREEIGQRIATERGAMLVSSHDDPRIIAGQATATKELLEEIGLLDRIFVGLGGGSSLSGAALVAKALSPDCKVVGVEPEAGNKGQQSLHAGAIVSIPLPQSIADGAVITRLGRYTFPIIRELVDDIVTVSDSMLVDAMRFFAERMKIVVEPTGCLAAAAAFSGSFHAPEERIGVLISGGNVDLWQYAGLIGN